MSLDVFQQVLALSICSNLVSGMQGPQKSLQQQLQLMLAGALPVIGPEWKLVWGPVVWKHESDDDTTGPDNSWYVAYHPRLRFEDGSVHPSYVIAIAGTPAESEYVWMKENFAVNSVADFKAWVAGGVQNMPVVVPGKDITPGVPYIATGTVNTVHILLTTAAPEDAISPGMTLMDFFTNPNRPTSPRIITTGHSLGGALCPSLALSLVSAKITPADSTLTYPSAGPSPGNAAFTDLFVETLPPRKLDGASSYQGWNVNLVNTLDIVPQAWCSLRSISPEQNLGNIPPIYGRPVDPLVQGITLVAALHSLSSGVLYKPLPSQYFTGSIPSDPPTNILEFLEKVMEEHTTAYLEVAGIEIPTLTKPQLVGAGLTEKTEANKRFNYPVIAEFEWAREHPKEAQKEIKRVEGSAEAQAFLDGRNDGNLA